MELLIIFIFSPLSFCLRTLPQFPEKSQLRISSGIENKLEILFQTE